MHEQHPVKLVVEDDDLWRSRLIVFFRLLLAIPHLIWLLGWSILVIMAAVAGWLVFEKGWRLTLFIDAR